MNLRSLFRRKPEPIDWNARLAEMVARNLASFEVQDFARRRDAARKGKRRKQVAG